MLKSVEDVSFALKRVDVHVKLREVLALNIWKDMWRSAENVTGRQRMWKDV